MSRVTDERWQTTMWLSHHYPEDYDRCVRLGRKHFCRRCLALYPVAMTVMIITYLTSPRQTSLDVLLLVILPTPAVIEFLLEQFGLIKYRPIRQVLVTLPLAVSLGRGLAIYLQHPTSLLFWGTVVFYGGVCGGVVMWRSLRKSNRHDR